MTYDETALAEQTKRNAVLTGGSRYNGGEFVLDVPRFHLNLDAQPVLNPDTARLLDALERKAARVAVAAVAELARINEVDHLGGGLDLIPSLMMTLSQVDYEAVTFTIENAHTSIGYYSALAALGFLDPEHVARRFRQSLDVAGHVAWVPGGTQLNGGRLGVMIPAVVGQALGLKARHGDKAWAICHCGDAGWVSGQALNGFNAADLHHAPVTFVMQRNGIQLSGTNARIMDKDPRKMIEAMGVTIIEIPSLHDAALLYLAYREARILARTGRPSLIYPVGYHHAGPHPETLTTFAERYDILAETSAFAAGQGVAMDTPVWTPGALMSYRDIPSMLECLFVVNRLPGGKAHHDGHLKGRDAAAILDNPMMRETAEGRDVLERFAGGERVTVVTRARPAPGSPNLEVDDSVAAAVKLPDAGEVVTVRAGVAPGYAMIAGEHPERVWVVSCDLDPSTKLDKAASVVGPARHLEMSIQEQASAIMANGLAMAGEDRQLVVFSTFAAFFEGIAREGLELWRYQRNLNGVNEGLNVTFHMSHVGACTGRDHFSGWALDWVTLAMGYLPYLHRFYAPADARAAFVAIRDLAAHYGAHIIGIPRDNLTVLSRQDSPEPLWQATDTWKPVTEYRRYAGAERAILVLGAPAALCGEAAAELAATCPADVLIINGLPLGRGELEQICSRYPRGVVSVEDGIIGHRAVGLRGFAGLVAGVASGQGVPAAHIGIVDPRIAPSEGHYEVWEHFGITRSAVMAAVTSLV